MFKDVSSANKIKYNTWRRQENYILWRHQKVHERKSVLILLDHYQSQTDKMPSWSLWINLQKWFILKWQQRTSHLKKLQKSIGMKYGNYMEYQRPFSAIEDLNSHPDLWRISWRHWEPKECYWQHIILKQIVKWNELIKKLVPSYDTMLTISKTTGQNG